jgi:two-component system, LuxR family, response regulator FixJ
MAAPQLGKPVTALRHIVGVIDDDQSVRGALLRPFRTAGLEVSLFTSAEEYLSSPERMGVECLVVDLRLPGISGLDLLRQLRAESMPSLLITAHDDDHARDRAFAAGAIGFFRKPFNNRELVSTVKQALQLGDA